MIKKSSLLTNFGVDRFLHFFNRTPRVLFWHGVGEKLYPSVEREICDVGVFSKEILYLKKHFEIISISEFENRLLENNFSNREIVLTFDDGYANNLYVVAPILQSLNLPFTVFISAEHIESGDFFPTSVNRIITSCEFISKIDIPSISQSFDLSSNTSRIDSCSKISYYLKHSPLHIVKRIISDMINNLSIKQWEQLKEQFSSVRPMSWDEVIELSNLNGVTIGSHCLYHCCCHSSQTEDVIDYQISVSRSIIQDHINKSVIYFAYPNGDYTDYSNKIVSNNYNLGFSTRNRIKVSNSMNKSIVPRIGAPNTFDSFKLLINLRP